MHLGGGLGPGRRLRPQAARAQGHRRRAARLRRAGPQALPGASARTASGSPNGSRGPPRRPCRERAGRRPSTAPTAATRTCARSEQGTARWECAACLRAFPVKFLGLLARGLQHNDAEGIRDMTAIQEERTTQDLKALAEQASRDLEDASALEIMQWAVDTFGNRFCVTSSMEDTVMAHLARAGGPRRRRGLPRHRLPLRRDHRHPRRGRGRAQRQRDQPDPAPDGGRAGRRVRGKDCSPATPTSAARCARSRRWSGA